MVQAEGCWRAQAALVRICCLDEQTHDIMWCAVRVGHLPWALLLLVVQTRGRGGGRGRVLLPACGSVSCLACKRKARGDEASAAAVTCCHAMQPGS